MQLSQKIHSNPIRGLEFCSEAVSFPSMRNFGVRSVSKDIISNKGKMSSISFGKSTKFYRFFCLGAVGGDVVPHKIPIRLGNIHLIAM